MPPVPDTRATASCDPMSDDDWSPIRGFESPHHLPWKEGVARKRGLCEEDKEDRKINA